MWKGWKIKIIDSHTRHSTAVRSRVRQRKMWIDNVKEDLEKKNTDIEAVMELI